MKFRRVTSAALAAAIFASGTSITAFAAQDAEMTKALTYVKERVSIPKELTEFTHSTRLVNNKTRYEFVWKTADDYQGGYSRLNISITGKVITNYEYYNNEIDEPDYEVEDVEDDEFLISSSKPSFSKLSKAQLIEKAKAAIKKLNPTVYENITINEEDFSIRLVGNEAYMALQRTDDGIPVDGQSGRMTINKNTGELISFNINWIIGAGFAEKDKAVSKERAEQGFEDNFPVELVYNAGYDWNTKAYTPYLYYRQVRFGQIDALTGELSTFQNSYFDYGDSVDDEDDDAAIEEDCDEEAPATGAGNKVTFTDKEKEQLEKEGKLIKAEDALNAIKKTGIFHVPEGSAISSSSCFYDERLGFYVRRASFNTLEYSQAGSFDVPVYTVGDDDEIDVENSVPVYYGNFTINAETGRVLSFSCGDDDNGKSLNKTKTTAAVQKWLKKLLGDDAEKFEIYNVSLNQYYKSYDPKTHQGIGNPINRSIHYSIPRTIDGIRSLAEGIKLTVGNSGKVTYYTLTDYGIKYPKAKDIISESEAYDKYFEQVDYDLQYRCAYNATTKKITTAMVYRADNDLYIDAFTGKLTRYNGSPITVFERKSNVYTDISGSKYKKYAEKLADYGIYIGDENGKLNENKAITYDDFRSLLSSAGIYCPYDSSVKGTTPVTRQLAAKMMTAGVVGNSKVLSVKGIFKSPFKDVSESSSYVGYIAVAKAAGIMDCIMSKSTFSPKAKLTRGLALRIIYDYLSK